LRLFAKVHCVRSGGLEGGGGVRAEADVSAPVGEKGLPEGLERVSVNKHLRSLFVRISGLHRGCARQA
jgi:hypothetical protein